MALFNTVIEFVGSGKLVANVDTILFDDTFLTSAIGVSEAGHAGLDGRFVSISIVGALNELMDGLTDVSGLVGSSVKAHVECIDAELFVHDITHNLCSFDLQVVAYDQDPQNVPGVATNVIVCWSPIDKDNVRILLDAAASGCFVIHAASGTR